MSVVSLIERFNAAVQSGIEDWRPWREDILAEHHAAGTTNDRVLCLQLMNALMGAVERNNIEPQNLIAFRKLRREQYLSLLIQEAIIGRTDGNVDPVVIASITSREVRDGRMMADDEFHQLAVSGARVLGPIAAPGKGLGAKIRSWFK